ncbi:MAG: Hint domain-containing protein, partial [Albidovulum sp.]
GADTLIGGSGGDDLRGGDGNDSIVGGDGGYNNLQGGDGDDTIIGGDDGNDIYGNAGNDSLVGGASSDNISGGSGADTITGGAGDDFIELGTNDGVADTVVLNDGSGNDTIYDFAGPTDNGDGTYTGYDQFDVSGLTDAAGNPVSIFDVTVTDTNGDGTGDAILSFPNGETVTLIGVLPSEVDTGAELQAIGIPCFTRGTYITTERGEIAIEDLREGDRVLTMDHGAQPIRWIGSKKVAAIGPLAPIVIPDGALGNIRELRVSPQHRMLICGWQAELLFGEPEVLVAARHLIGKAGVRSATGGEVEYFHMLFDQHEIVFAAGAATESFHPGDEGMNALDPSARDEILELFPELLTGDAASYGATARRCLKAHEAATLMLDPPRRDAATLAIRA